MGRPEGRRLAAAAAALVAFVALGVLAAGVAGEMVDRRKAGFCRPDPGIPGATTFEDPTRWPLGERCFLRLADGQVAVREPGWWLTGLVGGSVAALAAGALAPAGSARRRLAWAVLVPAVPLGLLILATVGPRSFSRLVGLTSVGLGFGLPPALVSAAVVWFVARGRVLPTVLGSWLVWGALLFWQGRDSIGA